MSFAIETSTGELYVYVRGQLVWKRWRRPGMGPWSCLFQVFPSHTYARPEKESTE